MQETIAFDIEIDADGAKKSLNTLDNELKNLKKELKGIGSGSAEWVKHQEKIGLVEAAIKRTKKENADFQKQLKIDSAAEGSYTQLGAKLNDLKAKYRELSKADREGEIGKRLIGDVKALDAELKGLDADMGVFTRNVGDYENGLLKALGKSKLGGKIEAISQQLGGFGAVFAQVAAGFAAFQAVAQAGKVVYDFAKEFENASKVVQAASGEMGASVQANTESVIATSEAFGVSVEDVSAAAKKLADTGAVDFAGALELINEGLLSGQADAEGYVKAIGEDAAALANFGQVTEQTTEQQAAYRAEKEASLAANKELAKAQGELSAEFQAAGKAVGTVGVAIKTGLVNGLLFVISVIKPTIQSIVALAARIYTLAENFGLIRLGAALLKAAVVGVVTYFGYLAAIVVTAYTRTARLILAFAEFANAIPFVREGIRAVVDFISSLIEGFAALPAKIGAVLTSIKDTLTGMVSAVGNAVYDMTNWISGGLLDKTVQEYKAFNAEIEAEQQRAAAAAAANEQARAEVEAANIKKREDNRKKFLDQFSKDFDSGFFEGLTKQQQDAFEGVFKFNQLNAELKGKDAGTAYSEAYAAGLEALGKLGVDVTTKEQDKINKDAAEKAKADAQKAAEDRKRLREEAFRAQLEFEKQNASVLLNQQRELADLTIQAIEDEQARQIALLNEQLKREQEDRKAQLAEREAGIAEYLDKQAKAFGKGSQEYREQQAIAAQQIEQDRKDTDAILIGLAQQTESEIAKIKADATKAELERIKADSAKRLQELEAVNRFELDAQKVQNEGILLEMQKGGAKELDLLKAQNAARKEEILAQLAAIEEAEKEATDLGIERTTEQSQSTLLQKKQLYNALLKLDIDQAQKEKDTAEKAAKEQTEIRAKQFDTIASYAQQSLNVIGDFIDALDEAEAQRLEQRAEAQEKVISDLEARVQNATGLQRVALEQQIAQEKKAGEKIAAERERLETERKKKAKATAVAESIINTAVAVTKVSANIPLAIVVGALGALQTAAILAQPLATGGLVGYPSTPREGGVIQNTPNSKRSRLGDEILIHAKRGEVVMNAHQIKKAGGYRALNRNFGVPLPKSVPAFATGGVVGAVGGFTPNSDNIRTGIQLSQKTNGLSQDQFLAFAQMLIQTNTESTQAMIDAQQQKTTVAVPVDTIQSVQNQTNIIQSSAQF